MTQTRFEFTALPAWILLVEDDETNSRLFQLFIQRFGFEVKCAMSAADAIELVSAAPYKPRLILMDWRLPDASGEQLLEALHEIAPGIPVAVLTGDTRVRPTRDVCSILYKPFSLADLQRLLPSAA